MRFPLTLLLGAALLYATWAHGQVKFESHHDNGQLKVTGQCNEAGQKIGTWTEYDESGKIKSEDRYTAGQLEGERTRYWPNGQVKHVSHYKNGKKEGVETLYYSNGNTWLTYHYKNGKRHGAYRWYIWSGRVLQKGMYEKGQRHGEWWTYAPESGGSLAHEEYREGEPWEGEFRRLKGETLVIELYKDGELISSELAD